MTSPGAGSRPVGNGSDGCSIMSYVTCGAAYPAQESGRRPGILETTRATTIPSTGMANTIVIKMKLSAMNSNSIYPLFSELDILGRNLTSRRGTRVGRGILPGASALRQAPFLTPRAVRIRYTPCHSRTLDT